MLKIFTVALDSPKKYMASATYTEGMLIIADCKPILGRGDTWKDKILRAIEKRSEQGFVILVEDRSQVFCVGDATPFSFEDIKEGRSMLFQSLDWYFSMLNMGQIVADKTVEPFMVRAGGEGQKIEQSQDDKGRTIYKVDWSSVKGGTKAVLMCVVGAVMQPFSEKYLNDLYGPLEEDPGDEFNYESTFRAITQDVDRARIAKWDKFYAN
jgi:hypothetical protein